MEEKKKMDFKSTLIHGLKASINAINNGEIPQLSTPEDARLVFVTNFGMIEGDLLDVKENYQELNEKNAFEFILNNALLSTHNFFETDKDTVERINRVGFLLLSNATITPFANLNDRINMTSCILFIDQIVGVTAKNKD